MRFTFIIAFIAIGIFSLHSCIEGPDYPIEPVLTYKGLSENTIDQSSLGEDTLEVYLYFTDGDGDIGSKTGNSDVYIIDSRLGVVQDSFRAPYVPEKGTKNGIDGSMTFLYLSTCCIFPDGSPPCFPSESYPKDSLKLKIYMKDRAGHVSNEVETDWIYVNCN